MIDDAVAQGHITRDEAATYKLYSLFGVGDPYLPAQFISSEPVPGDGTMLFLDALKDWEQLSPEMQTQINTFITPKEITGTLPLTLASSMTAPQRTKTVADARKLGAGLYHLRGTFTAKQQARWEVMTTRGTFPVKLNAQTILQAGGQRIAAKDLKVGDAFDAIFQVTRKGKMIARRLSLNRTTKKEANSARMVLSDQVVTTAAAPWNGSILAEPDDSRAPSLAVDYEGTVYAVWYADTPQPGLYFNSKPRTSIWSAAQFIIGTSETTWAPALAVDEQKNLYLVWEVGTEEGVEIQFAQKNWNTGTMTHGPWTVPSRISDPTTDGYAAELGITTADNGMQLHVSWRAWTRGCGACTVGMTYREWRRGLGWQPYVTLSNPAQSLFYTTLAVDRRGRVGVAYVDTICANELCPQFFYRQCDVTQTAGDCSTAAQWSVEAIASPGNVFAPALSFDTSGAAHLVWQDFENGGRSIVYSTRPSAGAWSAPEILATVSNSNNSELIARIAAGTPNNVYVFWSDGVANWDAPKLYYRQWDGQQWSDVHPLSTEVTAFSAQWASAVVDENNVVHLAWERHADGILYADAPQIRKEIGGLIDIVNYEMGPVCLLTEYYDTLNFRIYFTRTFPDTLNEHIEKDCSIQEPQRLNNAPNETNPELRNPAFNGYPQFVVALGASLEKSHAQFSAMGYPLNQMPREQSSGRYPIHISSNPIWTNELPVALPEGTWAISFPSTIYLARTNQYDPDAPIDRLSARVGAHEFFHTLQWRYVPNACLFGGGGQACTWVTTEELRWWMEATAVWSEPKVYPQNGSFPRDLDHVLSNPSGSLAAQPLPILPADNWRAYGAFIFATYLEEKVANSDAIIRKTWEQYKAQNEANGNSSVVNAIDTVLQLDYATSLNSELPQFAWNNYFLIGGTYDRMVNIYRDVEHPCFLVNQQVCSPLQEQPEWELFRSWLFSPRNDYQNNNAGVLVDPERQFPIDGPPPGKPYQVNHLGAAYIEFFPDQLNLPANSAADLNLIITIHDGATLSPRNQPKISIIPILNFAATPHPNSNFTGSSVVVPNLIYTHTIPNFNQFDRVLVIISNVALDSSVDGLAYSYHADISVH